MCFYYVLTTFTTVGYGKFIQDTELFVRSKMLSGRSLYQEESDLSDHLHLLGDIYATSDGERVAFDSFLRQDFDTNFVSVFFCGFRSIAFFCSYSLHACWEH